MKRSLLVLCSAFALVLLCGCNKGGETSSSTSSSSTSTVVTDWTSEEKQMLTSNLFGQLVPFYYIPGQVMENKMDTEYPHIHIGADLGLIQDARALQTTLHDGGWTIALALGEYAPWPSFFSAQKNVGSDKHLEIQVFLGVEGEEPTAGKWNYDIFPCNGLM